MRVQMKTKIGGYRNGEEWPAVGGTIEVPTHEAESLIANGYATPLEEEDVDADQNAAELANDEGAAADADGDEEANADGDDQADAGTQADPGVDTSTEVKSAGAKGRRKA